MPDLTKLTDQQLDSMLSVGSQPGSPTHTGATLERERRRDAVAAARTDAQAERADLHTRNTNTAAWVGVGVATIGSLAAVLALIL